MVICFIFEEIKFRFIPLDDVPDGARGKTFHYWKMFN